MKDFAYEARVVREIAIGDFLAAIHLSYDPDCDEDFTTLLRHTTNYGVCEKTIAKVLRVAPSTVYRWRAGKSRPTRQYRVDAMYVCIKLIENHK